MLTSKSIINQRKCILPVRKLVGAKGMRENVCWGLVSAPSAASGSVFPGCERAGLNLEPRLQDEPWPLIA